MMIDQKQPVIKTYSCVSTTAPISTKRDNTDREEFRETGGGFLR